MKRKKIIFLSVLMIIAISTIAFTVIWKQGHKEYKSKFDDNAVLFPGVTTDADDITVSGKKELNSFAENSSGYDLVFGAEYCLEREKNGIWYEIADQMGRRSRERDWKDIAYVLKNNSVWEETVSLASFPKLKKGNYRLVKEIIGTEKTDAQAAGIPTDRKYLLIWEFKVS